uniref:Uncharacterized protein n=1 Tax=Lates calcarifer TaxID=8187 RepID=A0A4W6FP84_LATCA
MSDLIEENLENYRTAPLHACFPNTNQTHSCFQNYLGKHMSHTARLKNISWLVSWF